MKANELRIGNYVNIGYDCKVVRIDEFGATLNTYNGVKDMIYFHQTNIRPIPLTEEWLVNFGFGLDTSFGYKLFDLNQLYLSMTKDKQGWCCTLDPEEMASYIREIKHVHQLQNLYYALTGEELTIKPK